MVKINKFKGCKKTQLLLLFLISRKNSTLQKHYYLLLKQLYTSNIKILFHGDQFNAKYKNKSLLHAK